MIHRRKFLFLSFSNKRNLSFWGKTAIGGMPCRTVRQETIKSEVFYGTRGYIVRGSSFCPSVEQVAFCREALDTEAEHSNSDERVGKEREREKYRFTRKNTIFWLINDSADGKPSSSSCLSWTSE